ncbi:protease complex subunit PrcB family protein [Neptunitalea lumnitzerae]|uniref:protease complex subunit PrcB family protein n=1 Tax=Neptunitalea lumnitzerae TaxID=2965509 RepID=UPI00249093B1|nr:protease complex subunit PrcB family protein [Neptunitalea sp. Y10]
MKPFTNKLLSSLSIVCLYFVCTSFVNTASVNFETLLQSSVGGPQTAEIIVAKEPGIVNEFFKKVNSTSGSHLAAPKIDYSKEMLFVICMGEKQSGGYQIDVSTIEETANTITVFVKETTPEEGAIVTTMITNPFTVVKLKTSNKRIIFRK